MNTATTLPSRQTMLRAFQKADGTFDGVFVTAVKTTGIFCRPSCRAKKPRPENVDFFDTCQAAVHAGFRPCKRCRPMETKGTPEPWVHSLLQEIDQDPARRWRDQDLRERGLEPDRVRQWFKKNHGMTFHAYSRSRRLGAAIGQIQMGNKIIDAAFETGYESLSGFNEALKQLTGASPRKTEGMAVVTMTRLPTPYGPMLAGATDDALCLLEFVDRRMLPTQLKRLGRRVGSAFVPGENKVIKAVARELDAYFKGNLTAFKTPLLPRGTPFQETVWKALRKIPHGTTRSYAELAISIGQPSAVRAVARANGDNPIAIIVPCHRVIGSDGKLTGYGGGLWRKQRLLELEGAIATVGE